MGPCEHPDRGAGARLRVAAPPSTDLAAAAYRSDLFARVGFTLWDNSWYAGHHLPAYSLLAPALGSWLGPQLLNALAMVAATALFALLIDGCFPARATRIAAVWFAIGASFVLLANRVPYDLGLALGLGALLVLRGASDSHGAGDRTERNGLRRSLGRRAAALALAVLCAVASPVAGAFLALAGVAWALTIRAANGWPRVWPIVFTLAALAPIGLLTLAFPEGGTQPFVASAFYPDIAAILLIAALIVRAERARAGEIDGPDRPGDPGDPSRADGRGEAVDRLLLTGTLLYALALLGAYVVPSAVGGNVDRLGALLAGPILACVLTARHPRLLLGLAPLFLYWQLNAPLADFASAASDPAVNASYVHAAAGRAGADARCGLHRASGAGRGRPHHRSRGGALDGAARDARARLGAPARPAGRSAVLRRSEHAAHALALPRVALRTSGLLRRASRRAAGLLREGRGQVAAQSAAYLREIWTSAHWRLFAVLGATPLAQAPAVLSSVTTDSFTLAEPHPKTRGCGSASPPTGRSSAGMDACARRRATGLRYRRPAG